MHTFSFAWGRMQKQSREMPFLLYKFYGLKLESKGCIGAPDIVVEILSPGNNVIELKNKYDVYEEAGVTEYWVVSPQDKTSLVYTLNNGKYQSSRLMVAGDVVTSSVLDGFTLHLKELFDSLD